MYVYKSIKHCQYKLCICNDEFRNTAPPNSEVAAISDLIVPKVHNVWGRFKRK